jgi:hypothetical protein
MTGYELGDRGLIPGRGRKFYGPDDRGSVLGRDSIIFTTTTTSRPTLGTGCPSQWILKLLPQG